MPQPDEQSAKLKAATQARVRALNCGIFQNFQSFENWHQVSLYIARGPSAVQTCLNSVNIRRTEIIGARLLPTACCLSSYFASSICFTRLTTAGSMSYNPFTIFSIPGPSIGSISSLAFSASARS